MGKQRDKQDGWWTEMTITVSPAYGRDYPSKAAAIKAWNDNKDFISNSHFSTGLHGAYINKQDHRNYCPTADIKIRYNRLRSCVIVNCDGYEVR